MKTFFAGLFRKPTVEPRRLRLEPLESRTLLAVGGFAGPALAAGAVLPGPWPAPIARVVVAAHVESALFGPQSPASQSTGGWDVDRSLALAPLAPSVQLRYDQVAVSALETKAVRELVLSAASLAEPSNSLVAKERSVASALVDSGRVGALTVLSSQYVDAILLTPASPDKLKSSGSAAEQRFDFLANFAATDRVVTVAGSAGDNATFVVHPWLQTPPALDHPSVVSRSAGYLHALSTSHEVGSVEAALLNTSLSEERGSRSTPTTRGYIAAGADSAESIVALSSVDLAAAVDLMAGNSAIANRDQGALLDRDSGDAAKNASDVDASLEAALPDLISPLAHNRSSLGDGDAEGGYVRINTAKTSRSAADVESYRAMEHLWKESAGDGASRGTADVVADQAQAAMLEGQTLKNRLRRSSRAGAADDDGMIQFAVASSAGDAVRLMSTTADGIASLASRDVRINEAVGLFQAFEVATDAAGDAQASGATAARATASISTAEPATDAKAAAADNSLAEQPVERAATAIGIVVVSMLTAVRDKRKEETSAERDGRPSVADRSFRFDRLS